jgi:DtxR family manganese transport transcriptional regulator
VASAKQSKNQHSRTRSDHATELAEDYAEAIATIIAERGTCRAVDLVEQFQVSHVTVNRTIGRLQRDGYVATEPYGPIELTAAGTRLAKASRRRHEVVYRFLVAIGVSQRAAAADSEGIEHHVSPETLAAMRAFLDGEATDDG